MIVICGNFATPWISITPMMRPTGHFDYSIKDETHFESTGFKFSVVARRNTQGGYVPGTDDYIKFTQLPDVRGRGRHQGLGCLCERSDRRLEEGESGIVRGIV